MRAHWGAPQLGLLTHGRKPSVLTKMAAAILVFWLHVKNVQKGMFFCDSARSPHRTAKTQPGVLSPSALEGAPGGDPHRSAIAERHVRISIRVLGVSARPKAGKPEE